MAGKDETFEGHVPFYQRPNVQVEVIPVGGGVPFGFERVSHPELGIGGAYGTWGESYDNKMLPDLIERTIGRPMNDEDKLDLSPLGFDYRHHIKTLTDEENLEVEIAVGARMLREAAKACGWEPAEVDAVMIGMTGPVSPDYTERIARAAGVPEEALKVSVHKACDSSTAAMHLALNPELVVDGETGENLAAELIGKKVLVGGIEGLSRYIIQSRDLNAMQLFGNGAGVIGLIPGKSMNFIVGKTHEVFDEKGVLAVHMYYPHSRHPVEGHSRVEITREGKHHIRVAGMMHEPESNAPVEMTGQMGMVKLFVRNGVEVVNDVYNAYRKRLEELGMPNKSIVTTIVHHANLKINTLKAAQLQKIGVTLSMPWLLSEFGNVSAASNMIAFLRNLPSLKPGDHILFDGFGAGTYYDVFAVALGNKL